MGKVKLGSYSTATKTIYIDLGLHFVILRLPKRNCNIVTGLNSLTLVHPKSPFVFLIA